MPYDEARRVQILCRASSTDNLMSILCMFIVIMISGCSFSQPEVIFQYPDVGFSMKLPDTWMGYWVDNSYWEGAKNDPESGDVVVETGPMITIHHPDSTPENPRQGIPIMVLTIPQWEALMAQKWYLGAAPVHPTELGRNSRFIFMLPARYNYAYLTGWEEVEEIILNDTVIISEPQIPVGQ